MKKIIVLICINVYTFFYQVMADNRIIIYLRPAPEAVLQEAELEAKKTGLIDKIIKNIDTLTPGQNSEKLTRNTIRSYINPPLSGLATEYAGYKDISNSDGLISFPLRHTIQNVPQNPIQNVQNVTQDATQNTQQNIQNPVQKLYVAITPDIKLVPVKDNTFSHREFINDQNNPAQLYLFQLKQDEKKHWYWDVTEEKIPENKKINPLTVVIFTNPKNIYVPTGHFLTTYNAQLILPSVYLIGNAGNEQILLGNSMNMGQFYEPIMVEQKKASDQSIQSMIANP